MASSRSSSSLSSLAPSPGLLAQRFCVLAVVCPWLAGAADNNWQETRNEDGKMVQQLKIEAPSMTEEDQYGHVMPDRYKCDSCKAVMFHLDAGLRKKQPKSRRLKQWEYTDIFDDVCRGGFEGYGIKLIDGENALSGPGLPRDESLAPGSGAIQMSSENWSKRLGEVCRKIVYEGIGEEETYDFFYDAFKADAGPGLNKDLCQKELKHCTTGPKAPPKKEKEEEKKPKKKEAKPKKEKKPKAEEKKPKAAKAQEPAASPAGPAGGGEKMDVETFLRKLASSHGLTSDKYLSSRTEVEWEKTLAAMAGRIFNDFSEQHGSESCAAKR